MLKIYFARHGETDWNIEGRLQGLTDIALNAKGLSQARLLAGRLAAESDFIALYTSPLRRALVTGEIIGAQVGLTPQTDARLAERNLGELEGMTGADIKVHFPDFHRVWHVGEQHVPFPGEEPRADFYARLAGFLRDVQARHAEGKVIVVTHGGAMGMIMAILLQLDLARRFPFWFENASLNIVEFGGAIPRVRVLNDTCHLRECDAAGPVHRVEDGPGRATLQTAAL